MVLQAQRSWGLRLAICLFLEGAGASALIFSLLLPYLGTSLEVAAVSAAAGTLSLLVAALFLMADLGRGLDISSALIARRLALLPNWASWVLRGSVTLAVSLVLGAGYSLSLALAAYNPPLPLTIIAGVFALFVVLYAGFLLASSRSTPFWNSAVLPLLFLFSGLSSGLALVYLISIAVLKGEELTGALTLLRPMVVPLIIFELITLAAYLEGSSHGQEAVRESLRVLTRGLLAPLFWLGVVIVGLILPLLIFASPLALSPVLSAVASLFLLFGAAYLRHLVIKAGVRVLPLPPTGRPVTIAGWTQHRR